MITTYVVMAAHEDEMILVYAGTDKENARDAGRRYAKHPNNAHDFLAVDLHSYRSGEPVGGRLESFDLF